MLASLWIFLSVMCSALVCSAGAKLFKMSKWDTKWVHTVDGILHHLIGSLFHCLQATFKLVSTIFIPTEMVACLSDHPMLAKACRAATIASACTKRSWRTRPKTENHTSPKTCSAYTSYIHRKSLRKNERSRKKVDNSTFSPETSWSKV